MHAEGYNNKLYYYKREKKTFSKNIHYNTNLLHFILLCCSVFMLHVRRLSFMIWLKIGRYLAEWLIFSAIQLDQISNLHD